MTEAAEKVKVRCKRCGAYLYTALLRSDIKINLDEVIRVPCRKCGDGEDEDKVLALVKAKIGKPREIRCVACNRFICTLYILREFAELGEIVKVENVKCRCKFKNGFTVMSAPDKEDKP